MKLLLTSAGILNKSLSDALLGMVKKPSKDLMITFVPTAANVEEGDKWWVIKDLMNLQKLSPKALDIVDFSALEEDRWRKRLEDTDIIVMSGGNTFYLAHQMREHKFDKYLEEMLHSKVYVGISAGSMVMGHKLYTDETLELYYDHEEHFGENKGLGKIDLLIRPHLNSDFFPDVTDETLKKLYKNSGETVYALDDDSGLKIVDGEIKVISEGKWFKYN